MKILDKMYPPGGVSPIYIYIYIYISLSAAGWRHAPAGAVQACELPAMGSCCMFAGTDVMIVWVHSSSSSSSSSSSTGWLFSDKLWRPHSCRRFKTSFLCPFFYSLPALVRRRQNQFWGTNLGILLALPLAKPLPWTPFAEPQSCTAAHLQFAS